MTLTEFLLARIAEDEYNARNATGNRWHGQACEVRTDPSGVPGSVEPFWFLVAATGGDNHFRNALHVARWDPARVLAECQAKRKLLDGVDDSHVEHAAASERWKAAHPEAGHARPLTGAELDELAGGDPCRALRGYEDCHLAMRDADLLLTIAAVYSDHAEFRQEWAPGSESVAP